MLFGSSSLEVLIGVVLLFLVLAVIASAVTEIVGQVLGLRSKTLADGIQAMLFDKAARDKFYEHPLIKSLSHEGQLDKLLRRSPRPSYIPSDVFARALLDVISVKQAANGTMEVATASPDLKLDEKTQDLFKALAKPLGPAVNEAGRLAAEVEKWFDDGMDRVSGWYKRKTQLVLFTVGVVIVIWANANIIRYVTVLSTNPDARAAVVAAAESEGARLRHRLGRHGRGRRLEAPAGERAGGSAGCRGEPARLAVRDRRGVDGRAVLV